MMRIESTGSPATWVPFLPSRCTSLSRYPSDVACLPPSALLLIMERRSAHIPASTTAFGWCQELITATTVSIKLSAGKRRAIKMMFLELRWGLIIDGRMGNRRRIGALSASYSGYAAANASESNCPDPVLSCELGGSSKTWFHNIHPLFHAEDTQLTDDQLSFQKRYREHSVFCWLVVTVKCSGHVCCLLSWVHSASMHCQAYIRYKQCPADVCHCLFIHAPAGG